MAISYPVNFIAAQSTANPLTKAYGAPVEAGDVLVAFVAVYNATETCTGVSDSVNGAWTQAYGPISGATTTRTYAFYKLNSAAGTPTVTANFSSTNHHELSISVIRGLSGGGAFDLYSTGGALSTNPSIGPTATLGAAVCAAVACQYNSGVTPTAYGAGWTLDANLNSGWERSSFIRQTTSSNAALTASWTQSNSYWVGGVLVFKDAGGGNPAPTFSGPNIGNQTGTVGTALSPNTVSDSFIDSDALTFSAIGSWPAGVTVSSAGVISGTPTTAGTYASLQVRATDTAAQTVDSDTFSFTISAASVDGSAAGATITGPGAIFGGAATAGNGATGSFTFDPCKNNTETAALDGVSVNWAWHSGGVIGVADTIKAGTGTMSTSGMPVSNLPLGIGYGIFRSADGTVVGYQEGTVT